MPRRRGKVAARISTLQRATRVARALTCDVALIASLGRQVIAPALKPDGRSGSTASRRVRPFPGSSGRSGQRDDARSRPAPKSRRMTEQRLRSTDFGLTLRSLEASPIDGPSLCRLSTRLSVASFAATMARLLSSRCRRTKFLLRTYRSGSVPTNGSLWQRNTSSSVRPTWIKARYRFRPSRILPSCSTSLSASPLTLISSTSASNSAPSIGGKMLARRVVSSR